MSSNPKTRSLTVKRIAKLTRKGRHRDVGDGCVRGLYLQVGTHARKSWVLRYELDGQERMLGLGSFADFSLKEARERARVARQKLADKRDPLEERRAERARERLEAATAMTFKHCAERYIAAHQAAWRYPYHAAQWPSTLGTYVYPVFGSLPVQAIDVGLVLKAIEPIWTQKPETAGRVRGRIESILDWAAARGYRKGDNPARWRGHLENLLPAPSKVRRVQHHAALPYEQLPAFMADLRTREGVAARALEFTILTAARTGEVVGAKWEEIDLDAALWTVPAERMKAGKVHRVPLAPPALQLLRHLYREDGNPYVFIGSRSKTPLSNMALLMTLRRTGRGDLTAHGFRSTFSDWAAERTAFASEVRELALAHAVASKVEAAYRRGDLFEKRRLLAQAWADFCDGKTAGAGAVVPLQRRQP